MKLSFILSEARKHPHLNQKVSINSIVRREYDKAEQLSIGIKNSFVSFTRVEKLGINPKSRFNTPIGIYCYPSEYVLDVTRNELEFPMKALPFAGEQPYANIFSVQGNILRIDTMDSILFWEYIEKIKNVLESKYKDVDGIITKFEKAINVSYQQAIHRSLDGGRFWYITMVLSQYIGSSRNINSVIVWNTLFREIGVDGVVDMGVGIIHNAERTQAVIFKLNVIKNLVRADNKYSAKEQNNGKVKGEINKEAISEFINMSEHNQILAVLGKHSFINYIKSAQTRNEILHLNHTIIFSMRHITKKDVINICQSSKLNILVTVFNNDDIPPPISSNHTKASYKNKHAEQLKVVQIQQSFKKMLSEQDIIHIIHNYFDIDSDYRIKIYETLLKEFPLYDKMFIELLQKIPSTVFALFEYLSSHYKQVLDTYCEELGKKDPDNKLYTRYKQVVNKYNKHNRNQ